MIFGPEGGLSENEISLFSNTSTVVGLGPRIFNGRNCAIVCVKCNKL